MLLIEQQIAQGTERVRARGGKSRGRGLGAGSAPPSAVLPSGLELSVQNPSLPGFSSYVGVLDGEGNGTSLQYFCLENPMDGRAW